MVWFGAAQEELVLSNGVLRFLSLLAPRSIIERGSRGSFQVFVWIWECNHVMYIVHTLHLWPSLRYIQNS